MMASIAAMNCQGFLLIAGFLNDTYRAGLVIDQDVDGRDKQSMAGRSVAADLAAATEKQGAGGRR